MMKNYNISDLKNKFSNNDQKIVLFGAGDVGELTNYSLNKLGITVDYFCDNDKDKQGKKHCCIDVLSFEDLLKLNKEINIFISNNYISSISEKLRSQGFTNLYDCVELLRSAVKSL